MQGSLVPQGLLGNRQAAVGACQDGHLPVPDAVLAVRAPQGGRQHARFLCPQPADRRVAHHPVQGDAPRDGGLGARGPHRRRLARPETELALGQSVGHAVQEGGEGPGVTPRLGERGGDLPGRLRRVQGAPEHLDVGVSEAVDRLLGVADDLDPDPARLEPLEEAALQRVDVLELVDEGHREARRETGARLRHLEEPQRAPLDLARSQQDGPEARLETGVDRLVELHEGAAARAVPRLQPTRQRTLAEQRQQPRPGVLAEQGRRAVQRVRLVGRQQPQAAHLLLEHRGRLPLPDHREGGVEPEDGRREAQGRDHEAVDGAQHGAVELASRGAEGREVAGGREQAAEVAAPLQHLGEARTDALTQLVGRRPREGDAGDAPERAPVLDQLEVALHQAGGLPGSGRGDPHPHGRALPSARLTTAAPRGTGRTRGTRGTGNPGTAACPRGRSARAPRRPGTCGTRSCATGR